MILVDSAEPDNILKLLRQTAPVVQSPLNKAGMSDYFFGNYEGKKLQFGRVQAGELVGNIDSMEDELRRYYNQADENYQIIEGIISPDALKMKGHAISVNDHSMPEIGVSSRQLGAKLYCYRVEPGGYIERGHSFSAISEAVLQAWIHRLAKSGVITYTTSSWISTARLLSVIYRNEQKPPDEHSTLQRVSVPRIHIKEHDPFVKSLMFLSHAYKLNIGEVKAKAIATRFSCLMDLVLCSVGEVAQCEGIGKKMASRLLEALGRSME